MHVSELLQRAALYAFKSERHPSMWFPLVTDSGHECRENYSMHYMELTHDGEYQCQNCEYRISMHDVETARYH